MQKKEDTMGKILLVSFLLMVVVFGAAVHAAVVHSLWEAALLIAVSGGIFYLALSTARDYGEKYAAGTIVDEKELFENDEIYEALGAIKIPAPGYLYETVMILRLRNGEIRVCKMNNKDVPSAKVFRVKRGNNGICLKYEYPPKDL